jgi:hypothetical protein
MNSIKTFRKFLVELHLKFPEQFPTNKLDETEIDKFHKTFIDHSIEIITRKESIWESPKVVFGYDLSELWKNTDCHDMIWKNLQGCLVASMFHGKLEEKMGENMPTITTILKGLMGENNEIDDILNDDSKQSKLIEFFEFLKETKIASLLLSLFEKIDFSELDVNIGSTVEEMQEKLKNIQNDPAMVKIQNNIKSILEEKSRTGEFSREIILREIEQIKEKIRELFGDVFDDILGTRKADVPSEVITSNTPEARRARMIARMQRKLKERK